MGLRVAVVGETQSYLLISPQGAACCKPVTPGSGGGVECHGHHRLSPVLRQAYFFFFFNTLMFLKFNAL